MLTLCGRSRHINSIGKGGCSATEVKHRDAVLVYEAVRFTILDLTMATTIVVGECRLVKSHSLQTRLSNLRAIDVTPI
jgi:hypothetical protein